jgi:hypothetical protein
MVSYHARVTFASAAAAPDATADATAAAAAAAARAACIALANRKDRSRQVGLLGQLCTAALVALHYAGDGAPFFPRTQPILMHRWQML